MKSRLFVAINLSEEIKSYLFGLNKELDLDAKIKWVAKKNLHLTLKFLGYVENANEVVKLLENVKFDPFEFKLSKLGVFDFSRPKVLFVDLTPKEKIMNLQFDIEECLKEKFPKDKQFSAHITLGRIKLVKKKETFLETIKNFKVEPLLVWVNSFYLVKSELKKDGPVYSIVKEFLAKNYLN